MMNLIKAGWQVGILLISIIKEKNNQNPETRTRKELLCPPLLTISMSHYVINSSRISTEAPVNITTRRKMRKSADTVRRRNCIDALLTANGLYLCLILQYATACGILVFTKNSRLDWVLAGRAQRALLDKKAARNRTEG